MTEKPLPQFRPSYYSYVESFAQRVFGEHLITVLQQPGDYFRAVFDTAYFVIQEGSSDPSKSQWNTLKKRIKRMNPTVFILKEHGETDYNGERYRYIDFGFLKD